MRLQHMTWPQAQDYFTRKDLVLLGVGSNECHGRHIALGTDTLVPEKLLELIEARGAGIPHRPGGALRKLR